MLLFRTATTFAAEPFKFSRHGITLYRCMTQKTQKAIHDKVDPVQKKLNIQTQYLPSASSNISFRAKLKEVPIDTKLLRFLDNNKLGFLTTRRTRKKVAVYYRRCEESEGNQHTVNQKDFKRFPFHRKAKRVLELHDWKPEWFPAAYWDVPQIAIIGRSNVGKSSLLNFLAGFDKSFVQKSPISEKPGETKSLVFYHAGSTKFSNSGEHKTVEGHFGMILVDMPGYGFAYMNEDDTKRCRDLTIQYLLSPLLIPRCRLQRILLLLDARHGLKQTDAVFLHQLHEEYRKAKPDGQSKLHWKIQIVLTKCDLVERMKLCKLMSILKEDILERFPSRFIHDVPIVPISVKDEKGVGSLLSSLYPLASYPNRTVSKAPTYPVQK